LTVTYVYSNKVNQSEFKRNSEYQAYLEFVEAVSSIKTAQKRKSTKDLSAYQKKLIDAKSKILIVGSKDTVQALSDFEIYGPYIRDQKSKKLFSNLITAMRSAFKEKPISFKLIDNVLLGGPNTFSDVEN
jgi:hypothetical protein